MSSRICDFEKSVFNLIVFYCISTFHDLTSITMLSHTIWWIGHFGLYYISHSSQSHTLLQVFNIPYEHGVRMV